MTSDLIAPSRDDAITGQNEPRPRRAWRFLARTSVLALILGIGWIAGVKTQEHGHLDHLASAASTWIGKVHGFLEGSAREFFARPEERGRENASAQPQIDTEEGNDAVWRADLKRITDGIEEVRLSSRAAVEDLRDTIDRVSSSINTNHRELIAKLEGARAEAKELDRAGPISAKLEVLNERLERIERSMPVALAGSQPATSSVTPPAHSIAAPVRPSAPAPSPVEKPQARAEPNKIPDWVVREVINGTAILKGPKGIIGVSIGDLVPGIGRVQAIARQGGRWTVATSKGVITAR
jgi:hypothetical protein